MRLAQALCIAAALTASPALVAVAADHAPASPGPQARVIGDWTDTAKTPDGPQQYRTIALYDPETGLTHRLTYDADGKLVDHRTLARQPRPEPEEIEAARKIVAADLEIVALMRARDSLYIDGGFILEEPDGPCSLGTRCLQMLVFDGRERVRHMVVDLSERHRSQPIVYRDYVPQRGRREDR